MAKPIGKALTQAELDEGPEVVIAERLAPVFASMHPKYKPIYPEILSELIGHVAGYPTEHYPEDIQSEYHREENVVEKLAVLVKTAKSLRMSLPGTDNAALHRALSPRLPGGYSAHVSDYYLNLGRSVNWLCSAPLLKSGVAPAGAKRKDPYAIQIAQAVCWYLLHYEIHEPTIGRTREGSSSSKIGVILGVILQVLDISLNGQLASVVETALKSGDWRDPDHGPWELIPTVRAPGG